MTIDGIFKETRMNAPLKLSDEAAASFVRRHIGPSPRDVAAMLGGLSRLSRGRVDDGARLAFHLAIATLPALAIGFLVQHFLGDRLRSIEIVAWTMIGFGIVLYIADRVGLTVRRLEHMNGGQALIIGIAQTLAFVPGTSRSGITIVAARLFGYERAEAARFSFLLSIPAIAAAGLLEGYKIVQAGDWSQLHDAALTDNPAIPAAATYQRRSCPPSSAASLNRSAACGSLPELTQRSSVFG